MPDITLSTPAGLTVSVPVDALRPLLREIVTELQAEIATDERLAYPEKDAAALLGVPRHVLRDARIRGQIHAVKLGRGFRYSRANLLRYLNGERTAA